MIVWLASFPRSGSLLLRQILYYTMQQPSYHLGSDENEIDDEYSRRIERPLDEFVAESAQAAERVFVKTHHHPSDEHPAIYVVRDGRSTIASFLKFERTYSPDEANTMLSLVIGDHYYGGWSEHYRAWHDRAGVPTLTLRYDELVDASPALLREIASFIGYDGPIAPWVNPIDEWRERHPGIVGQGRTAWEPPDEWTFVCDAVFWALHGELMKELELDDGRRALAPSDAVDALLRELLPLTATAVSRARELQKACAEKEEVISELARVCAEREAALGDAVADAKEKEALIQRMGRRSG